MKPPRDPGSEASAVRQRRALFRNFGFVLAVSVLLAGALGHGIW